MLFLFANKSSIDLCIGVAFEVPLRIEDAKVYPMRVVFTPRVDGISVNHTRHRLIGSRLLYIRLDEQLHASIIMSHPGVVKVDGFPII